MEAQKQNTPVINKEFLNRRFKHVFAYSWCGPKVGEESGGEKPPGRFKKNLSFAPGGREEEKEQLNSHESYHRRRPGAAVKGIRGL